MTYRVKVVATKTYTERGVEGFRVAQQIALTYAVDHGEDVIVINEDDDNILCVAVYFSGEAHLTLSMMGLKDDPRS